MKCEKCGKEIIEIENYIEVKHIDNLEHKNSLFYHFQCYKTYHKDKFEDEFVKKMKFVAPLNKRLVRPQ